MTPKIVVFAGSLRAGAYSGKTADAAMKQLVLLGADVTRISLADYALPIFDQDLEKDKGIPENALRLARLFAVHNGMLIASPEYNASIPPLLKNTIDWVSRVSRDHGRPLKPYSGMVAALCSSSPGGLGGIRGLYHLRAVLMNVGVEVITRQCAVPRAGDAFDDDGSLKDEHTRETMKNTCQTLVGQARLMPREELA